MQLNITVKDNLNHKDCTIQAEIVGYCTPDQLKLMGDALLANYQRVLEAIHLKQFNKPLNP